MIHSDELPLENDPAAPCKDALDDEGDDETPMIQYVPQHLHIVVSNCIY